jgi:hypothetical protein
MLVLLRRAGTGWIAATYRRSGACVDLVGGPWEMVRDEALRATGASPGLAPTSGASGLRRSTDPDVRRETAGE